MTQEEYAKMLATAKDQFKSGQPCLVRMVHSIKY